MQGCAQGKKGLRYYSAGHPVHRLAVMGGSGGDCIDDAYTKGCDTYVTADINTTSSCMQLNSG